MTDSGDHPRNDTPSATLQRIMNGKYRLLRVLGAGGTGSVYEALNIETGRRVALKTLHPRYAQDATVLQRFRQEARAPAKISHRNIVDVLDMDQTSEGEWFIVEEFLAGEDLGRRLSERGPLALAEALDLLSPIAEALSAAHRYKHGIIHRDVKPANIFLSNRDGLIEPKLIDFGIARWLSDEDGSNTSVGVRIGTQSFMSPEQDAGDATLDWQTDVWSFGLVLYVALGAPNPFAGVRDHQQYRTTLARGIPSLDTHVGGLPPELVALVGEMLQPDRAKRASDMREIAQRLHEIARRLDSPPPLARLSDASSVAAAATTPQPPPSPPTVLPPAPRSDRNPALAVGLGAVVGALLLGGILSLTRQSVLAPTPRDASTPDATAAPPPPPPQYDAGHDVPSRADVRREFVIDSASRVASSRPSHSIRPTGVFAGLPRRIDRGAGAAAYNSARSRYESGDVEGAHDKLLECITRAGLTSPDGRVCGIAFRRMN